MSTAFYYQDVNGTILGPVDYVQLLELRTAGVVSAETPVRIENGEWMEASQSEAFAESSNDFELQHGGRMGTTSRETQPYRTSRQATSMKSHTLKILLIACGIVFGVTLFVLRSLNVDEQRIRPVRKQAMSIISAIDMGVTVAELRHLVREFQADVLLLETESLSKVEQRAIGRYRQAIAAYKDSIQALRITAKYVPSVWNITDELDQLPFDNDLDQLLRRHDCV